VRCLAQDMLALLVTLALGAGEVPIAGRALRWRDATPTAEPVAAELVVSSPPPPPPPAPIVMTTHGCTCKAEWQYDGVTYNGCDPRHPAWKRPWCIVEEKFQGHTRARCGLALSGGWRKHKAAEHAHFDWCSPSGSEMLAEEEAEADDEVLRDRSRAYVTAIAALGLACAFVAARLHQRRHSRTLKANAELI